MNTVENWIRSATERTIARRALLTSLVVGTVLTAVNHGSELLTGGLQPGHVVPIIVTYAVPFAVSLVSSVAATRTSESRRDS